MSLPTISLFPPLLGIPNWPEMLLVLAIALIIFGPKQLPKIGRALGGGIKEFKDGLKTGVGDEDEEQEAKSKSTTTIEAGSAEPLPPGQSASAQSSEQRESSQKS